MAATIGILAERDDRRVALVPKQVKQLLALGVEVQIQTNAGAAAGFPDTAYKSLGATVDSSTAVIEASDVLLSIYPPPQTVLTSFPAGKILVSQFQPYFKTSVAEELKALHLQAFSMDMIPRSTLAQSMDVLSSMASIAGYQAVLLAAKTLPRFFPMMITAAGSVKPAKVLVLGAGVAGLQAIATAKRLGAVVEAFDVRSAAKEEVQSLGARFVEVEGAADDKDAGGYAVEQSEDYKRKQAATIQAHAKEADVIISTAQLRGKKAPLLIEADTIDQMKHGSVIIDLAASTGGNCAFTEDEKTIVRNGVIISGYSDLAKEMPQNASELYSTNLFNFLKLLISKEGDLLIDLENEIVRSTLITQ